MNYEAIIVGCNDSELIEKKLSDIPTMWLFLKWHRTIASLMICQKSYMKSICEEMIFIEKTTFHVTVDSSKYVKKKGIKIQYIQTSVSSQRLPCGNRRSRIKVIIHLFEKWRTHWAT